MQNDQTKLQLLIERLRMECVSSFADNLLGMYLHGSVVMGAFPGLQEMWIAWLWSGGRCKFQKNSGLFRRALRWNLFARLRDWNLVW